MTHPDAIKEAREKLPVFKAKKEIIQAVYYNKTVIFVGETASGKTTQIPQFLLDCGLAKNRCIAITQPRRVAAMSIAKRVAEEVRTELGGKVGYNVRFENVTSSATKIKYLTDGMLLREAISDPILINYSIIILDEAHERTLNNDLLFGIVKKAQKVREQHKLMPLKIIVMSATLDHNRLSEYFDDATAYLIIGREYSIKIMNSLKKQEDYVNAALVTIFQIHQQEEEGDILVFCTGQEEIDSMVAEVQKTALNLPIGNLRILPCRLYAALPVDQQTDVFKPSPPGYRKVIISTNIAETSVTIPGVKYVVDTGMVKAKTYNSSSGFDILHVQRISKAQADQRSGRAGREFNGICYRLYTVEEYNAFKDYAVPEILRCCLSNAILQMVAIGIKNIQKFDFIDQPSEESFIAAIKQLKLLDAVIENDGMLELTECGKKMVTFPLDPTFSKMIITSKTYKCTDEILSIISMLSSEPIFYTAVNQRERFLEVRRKFETTDGDHIMMLNVYKGYKNSKGNPAWCHENFINSKNMKKAITIRKQLSQLCETVDISPCSCNDTTRIRKCLASGLFMNTVVFHKNKTFKMLESNQKVRIHPSSCLFKSQPQCCIYTELILSSKLFMRNVSAICEEDLLEIEPAYFQDKQLSGFQLVPI